MVRVVFAPRLLIFKVRPLLPYYGERGVRVVAYFQGGTRRRAAAMATSVRTGAALAAAALSFPRRSRSTPVLLSSPRLLRQFSATQLAAAAVSTNQGIPNHQVFAPSDESSSTMRMATRRMLGGGSESAKSTTSGGSISALVFEKTSVSSIF